MAYGVHTHTHTHTHNQSNSVMCRPRDNEKMVEPISREDSPV